MLKFLLLNARRQIEESKRKVEILRGGGSSKRRMENEKKVKRKMENEELKKKKKWDKYMLDKGENE